jgi:hypothetical protein
MNSQFKIEYCSDLDYEEIVADISFQNHILAVINQEKGIESMEIEIFAPYDTKSWNFSLSEFIETLESAKKCLIEFRKKNLIKY